jgi:hypothetical protein
MPSGWVRGILKEDWAGQVGLLKQWQRIACSRFFIFLLNKAPEFHLKPPAQRWRTLAQAVRLLRKQGLARSAGAGEQIDACSLGGALRCLADSESPSQIEIKQIDQGAGKKKTRGPPWWVGGSEYEKGLGSNLFFSIFFIVFLNSPHRETPKNVIKQEKSRKN